MKPAAIEPDLLRSLKEIFGERLEENAPLARVTSARVGGPVGGLLVVEDMEELARAAFELWRLEVPFTVLGGGSNVLVSDAGLRGVALLNRARRIRFDSQPDSPTVWAESGANFGLLARQAAIEGLAGLEWAAGIPGTLGGAVVGNAGANGGDIAGRLVVATILQHKQETRPLTGSESGQVAWKDWVETWTIEQLAYQYRSSSLKRQAGMAVVLAARLKLEKSTPDAVQARMDAFGERRRRTQPPGASMGSMFKNPPGDYAGRLIEAAGLKGARVGDAEISPLHANFFINRGQAKAADIRALIELARQKVASEYGVHLELEIEYLGDWEDAENE